MKTVLKRCRKVKLPRPQTGTAPPATGDFRLLETGDIRLTENGDFRVLE